MTILLRTGMFVLLSASLINHHIAATGNNQKVFLGMEDSFDMLINGIVLKIDAFDPESIKTAAQDIMRLGSVNKLYLKHYERLLNRYSANPEDNSSDSTKVLRFILEQKFGYTRAEVLGMDRAVVNYEYKNITLLCREINEKSNEEIVAAMTNDSELWTKFTKTNSTRVSRLFVGKIKSAFSDNIQGMKSALTDQNNSVPPTLVRFYRWNTKIIPAQAIIQLHEEAFIDDSDGLRKALTWKYENFSGNPVLTCLIYTNNLRLIDLFLQTLKKAYSSNPRGLLAALAQENNNGFTVLELARECHEEVIALIRNTIDETQALIQ